MKNENEPRDLDALTKDLEQTLLPPNTKTENGDAMLRRQAMLLDEMLMALMTDDVAAKIGTGSYMGSWVDMVLRIQKQCAETVKTVEAIDYMKTISARSAAKALPTPSDTAERTEGSG